VEHAHNAYQDFCSLPMDSLVVHAQQQAHIQIIKDYASFALQDALVAHTMLYI